MPPVHRERRATHHDVLPVVCEIGFGDGEAGGERNRGCLQRRNEQRQLNQGERQHIPEPAPNESGLHGFPPNGLDF